MSMIADTLAEYIGGISEVADKVTGIRPMVAGIDDSWPYLIYETTGLTRIEFVNGLSNWYEGTVRLHICTRDWSDINAISEAIKDHVVGGSVDGNPYSITRIKFADEDDVEQAVTEDQKPYYVKVVDLWVRANKAP